MFTSLLFLPQLLQKYLQSGKFFLSPWVLRENVHLEQHEADSLCPAYQDRPIILYQYPDLPLLYLHNASIWVISALTSRSDIVCQFLLKDST